MGLEVRTPLPPAGLPDWQTIQEKMAVLGIPIEIRMVDGRLVLPGTPPPADWQDLRVGTPEGMITVLRRPDSLAFVVFGNASPALQKAQTLLSEAYGGS